MVVVFWHLIRGGAQGIRALRWVMWAFIAAGLAGIYFHLRGSAAFRLESNPSLAGWALLWETLRSKNPPSLAPGVMVQLGLLGLAYTYRHPALGRAGPYPTAGEES
jgi:hypothetical protein